MPGMGAPRPLQCRSDTYCKRILRKEGHLLTISRIHYPSLWTGVHRLMKWNHTVHPENWKSSDSPLAMVLRSHSIECSPSQMVFRRVCKGKVGRSRFTTILRATRNGVFPNTLLLTYRRLAPSIKCTPLGYPLVPHVADSCSMLEI
nr:hypothetical protein CFP56_34670 [Quercus suber]